MAVDHGLKGRAAVVTGSTSGIGQALADGLASAGVDILLNGFGDPTRSSVNGRRWPRPMACACSTIPPT
jgi:NAD(P)-dependent dehydrogenase (short-subunit alcohol dehydrogenase family)